MLKNGNYLYCYRLTRHVITVIKSINNGLLNCLIRIIHNPQSLHLIWNLDYFFSYKKISKSFHCCLNHKAVFDDISPVLLEDHLRKTGSKLAKQVKERGVEEILEDMQLLVGPPEHVLVLCKGAAVQFSQQ